MSAQDKIERTLKQIHVLFSDGPIIAGNPDKVVVDKKEVFAILEQLNLAVYELMDQYEATQQARELAQRRSEKKGEELLKRISRQADDVYAASLIYTDNALEQMQKLMEEAVNSSKNAWNRFSTELEKERNRIKGDQKELKDQLKDFQDSNKYLNIIEDFNRKQDKKEKEGTEPGKKIQNEAKHYALNEIPEIRVNPAYFERRRRKSGMQETEENLLPVPAGSAESFSLSEEEEQRSDSDLVIDVEDLNDLPPKAEETPVEEDANQEILDDIPPMPAVLEEEPEQLFVMPEIKVDLDAEYFKWQAQEKGAVNGTDGEIEEETPAVRKKERRFLFGKK